MTSFKAYVDGGPSTVIVLAVGLIGLLAVFGLGRTFLAIVRLRLALAWETALALVTGVLCLSVLSFGLSLVEGGVAELLVPAWVASACCGLAWGWATVGSRRRPVLPRGRLEAAGAALWASASLLCLLVALAPSTKIDELYYHMLLPSRIVADGGLRYYVRPWESAILAQMCFQLSASAPHAIGFPDAPNVISWGLGVSLSLIVWWEVRRAQETTWISTWAAAAVWVGLYPAVWWVTGGCAAFGDLSVAGLVLALVFRHRFLGEIGTSHHVLVVSLFATAAIGARISNAPLAATGVAVAVLLSVRQEIGSSPGTIVASALSPGLLFLLPIAAWTSWESGSPLGPIMAGWFGTSYFAAGEMSAILRETVAVNSPPLSTLVVHSFAYWSPVFLVSSLALVSAARWREWRARVVIGVTALQGSMIVLLLQPDPRFLSGIPYAALTVAAVLLAEGRARTPTVRCLRWIVPAILVPSLGLLCMYSLQFLRPSLGLQSTESFLREKTAFREDFVKLDRVLPVDCSLYVIGTRADNVYSPRPVVYDIRDWPRDRKVFLFDASGEPEPRVPNGAKPRRLVYENPAAVAVVFRTPGRGAEKTHLRVWAVE